MEMSVPVRIHFEAFGSIQLGFSSLSLSNLSWISGGGWGLPFGSTMLEECMNMVFGYLFENWTRILVEKSSFPRMFYFRFDIVREGGEFVLSLNTFLSVSDCCPPSFPPPGSAPLSPSPKLLCLSLIIQKKSGKLTNDQISFKWMNGNDDN